MPPLTPISLMIGLFGATLGAILSIKTWGDKKLELFLGEAGEKIRTMKDLSQGGLVLDLSQKHRKGILLCGTAWRLLIFVPIVVFALWAFMAGFYVSTSKICHPFFSHSQESNEDIKSSSQSLGESSASYKGKSSPVVYSLLFSRPTIFIVTFIDCLCMLAAVGFLIFLGKRLGQIRLLHRIVVDESTGLQRKRTLPPPPPPRRRPP